jgi:hypothetical protein
MIGTIFCAYLVLATISCGIIAVVRENGKDRKAQRLLVKTRAMLEVECNDKPYVSVNRENVRV